MPTIDELAPATAAADSDELPVSQNTITRKITRAQILAGVQTQLAIPSGTLLGRCTTGLGSPETIAVGNYLSLASGTLSATAAPYCVALLPTGLVPAATDLVAIAQGGLNASVTYSVFLQGLPAVANVDGTQLMVTPTGGSVRLRLADLASSSFPKSGGTLTGPLTLASDPSAPMQSTTKQYVDAGMSGLLSLSGGSLSGFLTLAFAPSAPLHAATKQYVDANPNSNGVINIRLPPCNAALNGKTDDTAAFTTAYQLAPPGGTIYVPNGSTVIQSVPNWGISTTKRVKWIVDGTTLANGSPLGDAIPTGSSSSNFVLPATVTGFGTTGVTFSQGNSQSSDFAVLHTSYVVNHAGGSTQSVISNSRTDTFISQNPFNHVWSGYDRLVWSGTQTPSAASPSRHIGRYIQAIRQSVGTDINGNPLPQPLMWSNYVQLLDTTGQPSSWTNASISSEVDWIGNGVDDANQRQIQSLVLGQNNTLGAPAEVSSAVGVSLAGGSTGKIYRVFSVNVPYSVSVLDTTNATQLSGAAAIRLAAGQTVAFEATNSVNLAYSSTSGAIIAKYGAMTCAVGRGISVSYAIVFSSTSTLPSASSGSIVFLVGGGSYTITLPPANTVMAGTGFTFSAIGSGAASISPAGSDTIDLAPVTLRQYDRLHIISDGSAIWHEVFRTNSVSPRFEGPPLLPSYSVTGLPATPGTGATAFATNGRKPNEAVGKGTGVEVFYDGAQWISVCSGALVTA